MPRSFRLPARVHGLALLVIACSLAKLAHGQDPVDASTGSGLGTISVVPSTDLRTQAPVLPRRDGHQEWVAAKPPTQITTWDHWIRRIGWDRGAPDGDEGIFGFQDAAGDQRATRAPEPAQPEKSAATDTALPVAEKDIGGAKPTLREEQKRQEAPGGAPAAPTPLYLNRALGLEDSPVRLFGWIENTFTGNTNGTPRGLSNFSVFPNNLANQWQGNQYYLVLENPIEPDDMVNLGFRLDVLFGNDWQFTREYGLFPNAFTPNQFAGLDLP